MTLKVSFHGATKIGKTSLVERLGKNIFNENCKATVGVNFIAFNTSENRYQCWDLSGDRRYESITRMYYKGSKIICLCFDPRKKESFYKITADIDRLKTYVEQDCQFVLIETCSDLEGSPQVSEEEVTQWKIEHGITYHVKTSAKSGDGLEQLKDTFDEIFLAKKKQEERHEEKPTEDQQPVLTLNHSEPEKNHSFLLDALFATAAVGGIGLCVAAIVTAGVVGSIPLAATLLAGGVVLGAVAAGTFFYKRNNQNREEEQYIVTNEARRTQLLI